MTPGVRIFPPTFLASVPPQRLFHHARLFMLRSTEDFGAGVGIAGRLVVIERNGEVGSDRLQLMIGEKRPGPAGYGDRVDGPAFPVFDPVALDQGKKHADIEPHIVGGDHPVDQIRTNFRPQLPKVGFPRDIAPGNSVDVGKHKLIGRRPDQPVPPFDDLPGAHHDQPELAGAVRRLIGGFKIYRGEIRQ